MRIAASLTFALLFGTSCARSDGPLLPPTCADAADCPEGEACLSGRCLPPGGDFDGDTLSNAKEGEIGSDPTLLDTDGDGWTDTFEAPDPATDLDRDGRPDVLERTDADADRDCIADQSDADDATPNTDEVVLRRECRFNGACTNTFLRQRASCSEGVLTCTFDGAPYPDEVCGDAIDNDCDAVVDEGCGGEEGSVGAFPPTFAKPGDVPGTLVIEKPFSLVAPTNGPIPEAVRALELDWVTDVEARCTPRVAGGRPPTLRFRVTEQPVGLTELAKVAPGAIRDARGRPNHLVGAGFVSGTVALEHLAGRWAMLELRCEDANAALGTVLPEVRIPVRIKSRGNGGESLAPRTIVSGGGCSTTNAGLWALFGIVLHRRRRHVRSSLIPLISSCLVATGCPSPAPPATMLTEGHGPTNSRPLFPFGGDAIVPSDTSTNSPFHAVPLSQGVALRSQRKVPGGIEHRFDVGAFADRAGLSFLQTDAGDTYLTASHFGPVDPPMLLVPKTVRVGMTWEVERELETDTLRDWIGQPLLFGDGIFRFTVSHRQVVHTRWGSQVVWRIEWAGPEMPYALDAYGNVSQKSGIEQVPVTERNRLRGAFDFVEGVGPVALSPFVHALDAFAYFEDGKLPDFDALGPPNADGACTLAERAFPVLPEDAGPLAAATPQDAPTLSLTAAGENPVVPTGLYPQVLQLTRSSREPAGELVLYGLATTRGSIIDPDGNTSGVYSVSPAWGCATLDDAGVRTAGDASPHCPSRVRNGAQPWVHPDGARWDPLSIGRVLTELENLPRASRPPMNEWPDGFEPAAPFWFQGNFQSIGTSGRDGPPQLRAFGTETAPDLLDYPREPGDRIPGVGRFALSTFVGGGTNQRPSFALPSDDGLTFVRPTSVLWLDWTGTPQHFLPTRTTRLGWSHTDGAHVRTEVGQAGELRRTHFDGSRVWTELLGRLALPDGHVGGFAVHVSGDRYLVFTQESPELRITGFIEDYANDVGLEQQPPRTGPLHAFFVTAPPTGIVDRDWTLRQVHVVAGSGAMRVCRPPGSALELDGARLGHEEVPAGGIVKQDADCWEVRYALNGARRTQTAGWTPLWLRFADEGWIRRPLPPLPDPALPEDDATFATLPDGSRQYPFAWVAPFGAGQLPVSTRLPGTLGTTFGMDVVPDASGAGLWFLGETKAVPNTCDEEPCLDPPYAPADVSGKVPYGLASRTRLETRWGPPGASQAVSSGGLVGPGFHLAPDGTVTRLPGHDADLERRFWIIDWRFLDGQLCGQLKPPAISVVGCVDANGTASALDMSFAERADFRAQEPGFLFRLRRADGKAFLDVIDVRTMDRRVFELATVADDVEIRTHTGADGTTWFVIGGAGVLVGLKDGVVERHTSPAAGAGLWSATATSLRWSDGTTTARPTPSRASCMTLAERCNAIDDDCSGTADDGPDLCPTANGTRACSAGTCGPVTCTDGFADCDGDASNGCETTLGTTGACTACGDACPAGATCEAAGCSTPPVAELASGEGFTCARNGLGDVYCLAGPWPNTSPPDYGDRWTNPARDVAQVVAGAAHACVRNRDGTVACWGQTDVAFGPTGAAYSVRESPATVSGITDIDRLWAGGRNTCARRTNGELWCWGPVLEGLVTPASNTEQGLYEAFRNPTRIPGWDGVRALALSGNEACGVRADGVPGCFGPGAASGSAPFETRGFAGFSAADDVWGASGTFSGAGVFAFGRSGEVHALGAWKGTAALGGPASTSYTTPTHLTALSGVRQAAIGPTHACFLTPTDTRCAGTNATGQLGVADSTGVHPSLVIHPAYAGGAATLDSTCLAANDGTTWCMGKAVEIAGGSPRWQRRRLAFWPEP